MIFVSSKHISTKHISNRPLAALADPPRHRTFDSLPETPMTTPPNRTSSTVLAGMLAALLATVALAQTGVGGDDRPARVKPVKEVSVTDNSPVEDGAADQAERAARALGTATSEVWGMADGKRVRLHTLTNANGLVVKATDYGTIVTEVLVPDRKGRLADVVLGRATLADYVESNPYFGCTAGRCANRIAGGRFEIDGVEHRVATNNGPNHLHGGVKGFDKVVWDGRARMTPRGPTATFEYVSPAGEEGYPGTVRTIVNYTLTNDDELIVDMAATTDAKTPVNLAHHSYWNLAGHDGGSIAKHLLTIPASRYTPVDATMIPTGELASVEGTPLDFRKARSIASALEKLPGNGDDPGGVDHNFVLDRTPVDGRLWLSAVLEEPVSGRVMEVWSDQPGIQFYSGNFLDGIAGKSGASYRKHDGLCLETQAFPDSVNRQGKGGWPDVVLEPGSIYRHRMVHRFNTK